MGVVALSAAEALVEETEITPEAVGHLMEGVVHVMISAAVTCADLVTMEVDATGVEDQAIVDTTAE